MTLLLCILECPEDPLAAADAQLLNSFGRQARQMQDQGDFETLNLLRACLGLEQLANAAISQAQAAEAMEEVGAESSLQDTFPHDALQGLLTNLPNRDIKICRSVARVLRIPIPESTAPSYGPLVPECVKPGTYGFGFEGRAQ
ncbi:hypothetical protein N0V88_000953 [Collariella sp. IMI 366227]|nr:hypothetical protein N0V88_000953 [Collariella sp. IMI 366227]